MNQPRLLPLRHYPLPSNSNSLFEDNPAHSPPVHMWMASASAALTLWQVEVMIFVMVFVGRGSNDHLEATSHGRGGGAFDFHGKN